MSRSGVVVFLFAFAFAGLHPPGAFAQTAGTSRTYVRAWEDLDGGKHLPAYEYLELDSALGKEGAFSLSFGGWGRFDLGEETWGEPTRGEVQYGYLTWRGPTGNRVARVGRLEVTGGVASLERLDGLAIGGDLQGGFTAAAWAGVPVETDGDGRGGDLLYGGRIAHRIPGYSEVGLSWLRERNDGDETREEQGVDLYVQPHRMVTVEGRSVYSAADSSWAEHSYRAAVRALPALTLTGDYQDVDYRSSFRSPAVSAFLPGSLLERGMRLLGAEAAYELAPGLSAAASWRGYAYDVAGDASAVGARLGYERGAYGAGVAYARQRGEDPGLRYREYRGYAFRRAGRTDVALELARQRYDEEIDGRDTGFTTTLAAGYALRPNLRLAADASYTRDPVYSSDVRGMLKLAYGFAFPGTKP